MNLYRIHQVLYDFPSEWEESVPHTHLSHGQCCTLLYLNKYIKCSQVLQGKWVYSLI